MESQAGTITSAIHTGNSTVSANGTMNAKGADTLANLKIQGKNMSVDDVVPLLPAFGVIMPSGASLKGGEGTILGGILGVLFIALIENAMIINAVGVFWQGLVVGLVLLFAVSLDRFKSSGRV